MARTRRALRCTVAVIDASNLVVNVTGNTVDPSQLNVLVDHASPYFRKGALGFMEAEAHSLGPAHAQPIVMNRSIVTLTLATVFALGAAACEKSGRETQREVDNAQAQAQTEITNAQVEAKDNANAAQSKADEKIAEAERDFDKTRDDYRHTVQSNLESLDKDIADLDAKTLKATGDRKVKLDSKLSTLRTQRATFAADVKSLDTATAGTWDAIKARLDKEWSDIKRTD